MWYIAFTLGLFGSLHCVGMCGPLAIAFSTTEGASVGQNVKSALAYNLGRTFTYAFLGLLFGTLGKFLFIADIQKVASIVLGILLVLAFVFSVDIDKSINNISIVKKYYGKIRNQLTKMMSKAKSYHPFQLGMANGLLPCGLVYLALAGAISTGAMLEGILFMTLFGLGTIPMLLALTTGIGLFSFKVRSQFRTILPYVTLCFGAFLIYRGVVIEMPRELNFWEALRNPVMCH